ncbi:MAG: hypothetical protein LQ350_001926 [Teloschistes chrysophthalmus]|nr:MAG: hypothetical protein LQ350_001926 [Niorma chrysophthalma]
MLRLKSSFQKKPYTAVTVQVDRLTGEQYEGDDMTGIVDLIEVIRLQAEGPTEAARAIRKKLKYGSVHKQLRALTILDGLIENAGPRFQRAFADEPLLERLRFAATDSVSDAEVKKKCSVLFRQWAASYSNAPGMERIAALHKQLPQRKKTTRQESSKVLRETEPGENEDPFGHTVTVSAAGGPTKTLRSTSYSSPTSSSSAGGGGGPSLTPLNHPSTTKPSKSSKKSKPPKPFNLEKEKPQLLQTIASSSVASTNLMNSLKLINRESKRVSEDQETVNRFETCKLLRRQVLRYIQYVESEQWLGSLIHANEGLVEALMAFEVLDKDLEDDSDSDHDDGSEFNEWDSDEADAARERKKGKGVQQGFAGLSLGERAPPAAPSLAINGKSRRLDDSESEEEDGDEDNPFGDINAVHTPKEERPGMSW